MPSSGSEIVNNRYVLHEVLGMGGMGTVYKATDRLLGRMVALKRVTQPTADLLFTSRSNPTPGSEETIDARLALAREFHTLATLRHPHIISVLDYGFDEQADGVYPYYVMSLMPQPQTIIEYGKDKPLAEQIRLLVQVLHALAYLHRRGVIHRDVKPANILVSPQGEVRVVDFGLSIPVEQAQADVIVGTLAYIAPEVLRGQAPSPASDIYALGVVACELLLGHYPFSTTTVEDMIHDILEVRPDLADLWLHNSSEPVLLDPAILDVATDRLELVALDLDTLRSAATAIIHKMIAKQPDTRFQDVGEIISALHHMVGREQPPEPPNIRESFLQAARFVGRKAELERLRKALQCTKRSPTEAHGVDRECSGWLIAGESGVGKSRLLDELSAHAMVNGVTVLKGHALNVGGSPYQPWHDPLRRLALMTPLDDEEAGALKLLLPDIHVLLNRPVEEPLLDEPPSQRRLLTVVGAMFRRLKAPTMLILEDMHWASEESLTLLRLILSLAPGLPLMIAASYRDDEMPHLPTELPEMHTLKLERLSADDMLRLSMSMIGQNANKPHIATLVERETEGNVFFLIEVMRALAEEAGQLDAIGRVTLPEQVFTGGVQRIVQRRLNRVPGWARALLKVAAAAGRHVDLDLLHFVVQYTVLLPPDKRLDSWLLACADAAVLEVAGDQWRFTHERLRESLLGALEDDERRRLYRLLARSVERVYPDSAALLAYYWQEAGDDQRAYECLLVAGRQAVDAGAQREARALFERALALFERLESPGTDIETIFAPLLASQGD